MEVLCRAKILVVDVKQFAAKFQEDPSKTFYAIPDRSGTNFVVVRKHVEATVYIFKHN